MAVLFFTKYFFNSKYVFTCGRTSNFLAVLSPPDLSISQTRKKHWNPKFRKERAKKVLKIDLPDFDEARNENKLSVDEMKAKIKEKGILPFRPWNEKPLNISSLGAFIDAYVPYEGDEKASILSTSGAKQVYDKVGKKGKSYMALRKIRSLDYEFDVPTMAETAKDIYIEAHKALANKDEDKLHDLVTEKVFPEMMDSVKNKFIKWSYKQTLEPPRIVHIRCQEMAQKDNLFAQITLRLFSQQTVAVYDRFGRLMHGSEDVLKDVLEYIVFEKQISNVHGSWRVHGKIIPDWLPPKEPNAITFLLPNPEVEAIEPPVKSIEAS